MRSCERCHTPYKTRIEFCGLDGAPVVERDRDPLVGTSFDRYRVTERLGGGGMAVVYRAQHDVIEREVAIKILFGELAADREFAERFRREANAASRIKHPNVVEIYDFGETPEGMSFLVMEMLRGETLNDAIQWTGPFSPRRAAGVLRQLASGLSAAHGMSFIHRDLKPGNVMLGSGASPGSPVEVAKILDFGLVLIDSADEAKLTRTGQTLGTPHYMAPEQFAGGVATVRSDLYALGAVLHEMLAGQAPFRGSLAEVVIQQQSATPPALPASAGLEELAARLLQKDPQKRPASTQEVIAFLDELALGDVRPEDVPPRPETLDLDVHQVLAMSTREVSSVDVQAASDEDMRRGAETEDVRPRSSAAPQLRSPQSRSSRLARPAGRALVVVALLGALALTSGLFLLAGPRPAFLTKAESAEASAMLPEAAVPGASEAEKVLGVQRALDRRGLTLEDVADLKGLAPFGAKWLRALQEEKQDEAASAAARLVVEIERARIDEGMLRKKLGRLKARLPRESVSPEVRALSAKVQALEEEIAADLSEAEYSRLALRIAALEAEAGRVNAGSPP